MPKTITVRVDESTYHRIKKAADAERRTISNFIEYATLAYVDNSNFVADEEMQKVHSPCPIRENSTNWPGCQKN